MIFSTPNVLNLINLKGPQLLIVLSLFLLGFSTQGTAQLSFANTVPAEINVCQSDETFGVQFTNNSGNAISNVNLQISFPTGIKYTIGSIVETSSYNLVETNTSNLSQISFAANNIPDGATLSFDFKASAGFDAMAFQNAGNVFRNNITVSWNGGSQQEETDPYNILFPALTISVVDPMFETVFVGQSYTRTITVVNGGYGNLSAFTLYNNFNSNLTLDGTDSGILDPATNSIAFDNTDFSTIGNGDNFFDKNESFTFNIFMTAVGCTSAQTQITAEWGCDGQTTTSNTKSPYTTINLYKPNLGVVANPAFNTCVDGSADIQELVLTNSGAGPASSVEVIIQQLSEDSYSGIEPSSIKYKVNNGAYTSVAPDNTTLAAMHTCLNSSWRGGFTVSLPNIAPADVVSLTWESYTCDTDNCSNVDLIGWEYEVTNSDMCDSKTYTTEDIGEDLKEKLFTVFYENPSDLVDNQQGEYLFTLSSATFRLPQGVNPKFVVEFDIPVGLLWLGNAGDLTFVDGNTAWSPTTVDYNTQTRKLKATYDFPIPIPLPRSEFKLLLTADCAEMGGSGGLVSIGMQLFYIMDASCPTPYRMSMTCYEVAQTYIHCPGICDHGLVFNGFEFERLSVGAPDNDKDGLPDASGSLNLNEVKLNRVMANDTFKTTFSGTIKTSATFPSFSHGYARSVMPYGNYIDVMDAEVKITDASTGQVYTCTGVNFTTSLSGSVRTINFDYSPDVLIANGCTALTGYVFEDGDQIELVATYKLNGNIGGNVEQVTIQNQFYVSDAPNGTHYQCNTWNGNFTIIGYYYTNYKNEVLEVNQCTKTIAQGFYMSIGNCCGNYSGGDLFPSEYRNWGLVKNLRVEVPAGYNVVSMSMHQDRTLYKNASLRETVPAITPISITGQTYVFDLEQYYVENGGPLNKSDDGFNGVVYLEIDPICTVNTSGNLPIEWHYTYKENNFLGGSITNEYSGQDYLDYNRTELKISTTLQTQEAITAEVAWDVILLNNTALTAYNSWIHIENVAGGLTNIELKETSSGTTITPVNGFYQLGDFGNSETRSYKVITENSSCSNGELLITTGFDCDGYPTDLNAFTCSTNEIPLYSIPQPSELQTRVRSFINPGDVCTASIGMEIDILSSKLASVDDLLLKVTIPGNQSILIEPGSMEVKYPASGIFQGLNTPTLQGSLYEVLGADMHSDIGANGLVGITDVTKNEVSLKFNLTLENNFKPGDFVQLEILGNRPCGNPLPTISVAFDPNAVFEEPTNIGLSDVENSWATSWADYNNDGFVDLFVTSYDTDKPNTLYTNNGNSTFTKVTTGPIATDLASSLAATWGDYDNDGDLDLYVANNIGYTNFLYRNEGNGTFVSILNDPAVNDLGYGHGTSWVDYDNDGFLDLFVADYFSTRFNQLYHNNGDGTFTKETDASPVLEADFSVSGVWGDYNNDNFPDLFVANTNGSNNSLYKNLGNGNFLKINTGSLVNDGGNSVGASWGDMDNDGDLDLFVSNSGNQNNFLYKNNGDGTFLKIVAGSIVTDAGHSHGSAWADYDNDGDLDLFVANDQDQNNKLYSNNGDGTFQSVTNQITESGGDSFGTAWADYDNDGDLDLFIANHELNTNFIYENSRGECQSKSCIILTGTSSNASSIGAKIKLKANIYGQDVWQTREINAQSGGGVGGQNELKEIIGLGDATVIDSILIEWPSGYRQVLVNQLVNDCLDIIEENAGEACGTVYYDENSNCIQDNNEPGISNIELRVEPGGITVFSDADGNYSVPLQPGTYTITQVDTDSWIPVCPNNQGTNTVDIISIGEQYCGNNFGTTPSCALPDLKVEISTTAHRVGFENLIIVRYENLGGKPANNAYLTVSFGDDIIPVEASLPWDLSVGTDRRWNFGTLDIGASGTIYITDSISINAVLGEDLKLRASLYSPDSDCNGQDNVAEHFSPAVGALDPNDILVSPQGEISQLEVLTYKIRFQNVGNATVNQVRIENQLPPHLDLSTLELGAASNPYRFSITDDGLLNWTFDNILLPDSTTNEPASHGYLTYRIQLKPDLAIGTAIENQANIFFDNNAPILTNIVSNTLANPNSAPSTEGLTLYPNPAINQVMINIEAINSATSPSISTIQIYDMTGKLILSKLDVNEQNYALNLEPIGVGIYTIFVSDEAGDQYVNKLVVMR